MKFKAKSSYIGLILLAGILAVVWFFGPGKKSQERETLSIQALARAVLENCQRSNYHPTCYEKEIPKLMERISMEEAFAVAKLVQGADSTYNYCHVLGHDLAAKETAKDISKWSEVIHRCPTGICSNGCLHGAAQERFRGEVLTDEQIEIAKQELIGVCDRTDKWSITGLEQSECFHGLGHLTVYMTGAKMPKALELCRSVAFTRTGQDFQNLCYEGAFMQIFQPLDTDDRALAATVAPTKKEDVLAFCHSFAQPAWQDACWAEGFSLFRDEIETASGTMKYCSRARASSRDHCYSMMFYVRAQGANYDAGQLADYCQGFPLVEQGQCFGDMSNAMLHGGLHLVDRAVAFCKLAKNPQSADKCYQIVVNFAEYNVPVNSADFLKLCNDLPPVYGKQCLVKRG